MASINMTSFSSSPSPLRVALIALLSLLPLAAVVTIAYELAAARVPQHRAALEDLIRHETGLEVRFAELSLRWGWYGPEAVFHGVELGEPGSDEMRLRAPRLSVALDAWRMVRSGQLEARRITLQSPDIDLGARVELGTAAPAAAGAQPDPLSAGARVMSRWRGGQIDIEGGTLRAALARGASPVTLSIRHAQLRRFADRWSADADLLLPEGLGAALHLSLQMRGDPATPALVSGTLSLESQRLEIAAWRALVPSLQLVRYLPQTGSANLDLRATFAHGRMARLGGRIRADSLAWGVPGGVLALQRANVEWQLSRRRAQWQLSVKAAELAVPADPQAAALTSPTPATLDLDVAPDGAWMRGTAQHAPVAVLAALARFFQPQLPLAQIALGGEARMVSFDWNARRPAGARLMTEADLTDLSVASAAGGVVLGGLSAHVSGADGTLAADLQAREGDLSVTRDEGPYRLDQLAVRARLTASRAPEGWRLSAEALEIRRQDATLTARGTIAADAAGAASLDARLTLRDADAAVVARVLGPQTLATLGAAIHVSAGQIESADILWHGPLAASGAGGSPAQFTGTLQLRDAALGADGDWPDASGVDARLEWRGSHVNAVIEHAESGGFQLIAATADWNTRRRDVWHFGARASGRAQQALAWLRTHPQAASHVAPGLSSIDLRGDVLLDLDVTSPPAASARPAARAPGLRVSAVLDGGELRPLAGLPPIGALRGTLVFAAGQLQRSTLGGQWLGGPVSLGLAERLERGTPVLTISGHGSMAAPQAVQAAGGNADQVPLSGSAEWSALLTYVPGADPTRDTWQLHADSNLIGLTSRLPEPFAKSASAPLPLRVELQARGEAGQLHVGLAERLTALAALSRRGDTWRIERGAVRLAGAAPPLPADPVVLLDGRVSRLDVVACLALLRQAAADAALPPIHAHLSAAQLLAGARNYPEVDVMAETSGGGAGLLQLQSTAFSASARWPASIDAQHPAVVHLSRFSLAQLADATPGAELAAVLAPAAQLFIDDLQWQGRALGEFGATLAARDDLLEARDAYLSGASGEAHGGARCRGGSCSLTFTLDSEDAAATLAAFGLRPEMSARHGSVEGELHWSGATAAPLATLGGHLHMQLDDGTTHPGAPAATGTPFALLSVPALLAGLSPDADATPAPLRFARVTADYDLRDGNAMTRDLHFDGDAEILLRGRIGLAAQDYDEQAWILRGEERLPSAVRRLGPTPKVAAVWLSLRELFTGAHARDALRLRGRWDDPIVTSAE